VPTPPKESRVTRYGRKFRYSITSVWYLSLRQLRQYRKSLVTAILLAVAYVAIYTLSNPITSLIPLTVAILIGTDYTVLDKVRLGSVRDRIEASDTTLERIERNLGAKELLNRDDRAQEPGTDSGQLDRGLELQHHGGKHFRGTVDDEYALKPPIRFRLYLDRSEYLLVAGQCQLRKVRDREGGGQVLFFVVTGWEMSSNGEDEKRALIELREAVQCGTVDQPVYARPEQTTELTKLELDEWRTLYDLYNRIAEYRDSKK
jgi:hypothetical protein